MFNKKYLYNLLKKTGPPVETGRPNDCYTKYLNYKLKFSLIMTGNDPIKIQPPSDCLPLLIQLFNKLRQY